MKFPLKTAIGTIALFAATPAFADATLGTCVASDPDQNALFCAAVTGNANNGSPAGTAQALNDLLDDLGVAAGQDFGNADWSVVGGTKTFFTINGEILSFAQTLFGQQIISIHFGGGGSSGGETIMYLFDFGAGGANSVDLNQASFSNAALITPPGSTPPVPEPATWMMMLAGFGAVGYAVRRRRRTILVQVA